MSQAETRGFVEGPAGPVAWRRFGTGPPLILINGYAATKDDWDPSFLAGLGEGSTVHCLDNRAAGESGGDAGTITIETMADDVLAYMDASGLGSAAVAAWSMGGFVAQTLAARVPDRVDRLVLMATDPGGPEARRRDPETHTRLLDHTGTGAERAERLLNLLFPPEVARDLYAQVGDLVAAAQEALPDGLLHAQESAMEDWYAAPSNERAAAIRCPAMVATGTLDQVIPPGNSELLAERLPASWLVRFPGGGHAFMAQEPVRLAAAINAFLDR